MNTLSINLRYRPLRLGWCITAGDVTAFRRSLRLTFTMWGGSFSPIIPIDDPALADALIRLYRVDALVPASDGDQVKEFIGRYKHLPWPMFGTDFFVDNGRGDKAAKVVDLTHPVARIYDEHFKNNPTAAAIQEIHEWQDSDPLADVFLATYGGFPTYEETGTDYAGLARQQLLASRNIIQCNSELPIPDISRMNVAQLNRAFISQHYAVRNYWDRPGLYVGESDNFEDLILFWNLRAAGVRLQFYDSRFAERSAVARAHWVEIVKQSPNRSGQEGVAIWHRRSRPLEALEDIEKLAGRTICAVDDQLWNGMNFAVPIVHFGSASALASIGDNHGGIDVSFMLPDQPFIEERGNYDQHYVVSVDPGIGLFKNERATLHAPFIPQLNEFYGRNLHFQWNAARAEPESVGLIINLSADHMTLRALDVVQLVTEIFRTVGIKASQSKAGLVGSSLIRQMGGLDSCRVFKIAGVRSLIENHRPDQSFSRSTAMQVIRGQGEIRPLDDYQRLYIEPRPSGATLTNDAVLGHLLDRGVFRAGLNFDCPSCQLEFWLSLDDATSELECEYCGHQFNGSRQLRDKDWAFRRSGLFGRDDHQEGGIPVMLALQQLMQMHRMGHGLYTTALNLEPIDSAIHTCETDLVVVSPHGRDHRIQIVIGECKTRKPITTDDVQNMISVANAFPKNQYDVFIVFARLTPFLPDEIALMKTANEDGEQRVIILTERELEPYFVYERTKEEFNSIRETAVSFEDMAHVTYEVFFQEKPRRIELEPL